jgi:hypothetical protein
MTDLKRDMETYFDALARQIDAGVADPPRASIPAPARRRRLRPLDRRLGARAAAAAALVVALSVIAMWQVWHDDGDVSTVRATSDVVAEEGSSSGPSVAGKLFENEKEVGSITLTEDGSFSFVLSGYGARADRRAGTSAVLSTNSIIEATGRPLAGPDSFPYGSSADVQLRTSQLKIFPLEELSDRKLVTRTTYQGRPALEVGDKEQREGEPIVHMTVDEETSLPLRASFEIPGQPERVVEIRGLVFSDSADVPSITPSGVEKSSGVPGNFVLERPGSASKDLSYEPLTLVDPLGFKPVLQQTHRGLVPGGSPGIGPNPELGEAAPLNPASSDVRIIAFRDGFREIVLTTRSATPPGEAQAWGDLYEYFVKADIDETQVVEAGAAKGATFHLVSGRGIVTHAWGVVGDQVVTIGGDLSVRDLRSLLQSLQVQPAG